MNKIGKDTIWSKIEAKREGEEKATLNRREREREKRLIGQFSTFVLKIESKKKDFISFAGLVLIIEHLGINLTLIGSLFSRLNLFWLEQIK